MKKAVTNTIGIIIIAAIVIGVIAVIAVPAGFIMKLFGFEYTSVWSIICFFRGGDNRFLSNRLICRSDSKGFIKRVS